MKAQGTILIVEDEAGMASVLADNLRLEGYGVLIAGDGALGLESWRSMKPDLVVLDVMLPRLSGYELCETMRAAGDRTPVLFLSAKGQPQDRVRGLEVGGDDYLAKPFHLPEFLLRVRALLRRRSWAALGGEGRSLRFGGHTVDMGSWTATLADGRKEALSERELAFLRLLAERADEVVSRDDVLDAVWGDEAFPPTRAVDALLARLRALFEPDHERPRFLHTVRGVGYRFTPTGETTEPNPEVNL